jgi:Ca2+-binding RTX toxin-like protein
MAEFNGTSGNDDIDGTAGQDLINGFAGDDDLSGAGGPDLIFGWAGSDTLDGGDGDDYLSLSIGGLDQLLGGAGSDTISLGLDSLAPPGSNATLSGGIGNDFFFVQIGGSRDAVIQADAGDGDDEFLLNGFPTMEVTLGSGQDVVALSDQPHTFDIRPLVITDFATGNGGDRLKWDEFLSNVFTNYDRRSNPFATGHARLVEDGADTLLQFDFDGSGSDWGFVDYFRLEGVAAADLTAFNLSGYPSDGSAPAGMTVTGTAGRDDIETFAGDDEIDAGADQDQVVAGPGDDIVEGGDGADILYGVAGDDSLDGGEGDDNITGGYGVDTIAGGSGNDWMNGGHGADEMTGGAGNDEYVVDNAGDEVIETSGGGSDSVQSFITYVLPAEVENLYLLFGATNGFGNDLANTIHGNLGANRLDGAGGADQMYGFGGDDLYIVNAAGDRVFEIPGEGTDTVRSSVTHILSDNVEHLVLTGGGNINATGNGLANSLSGNNGNNRLDGRAGADVMAGGKGHDLYVVNHPLDKVVEGGSSGNDTVESAVSYRLPVHFEKLILTGVLGYDGRGNAAANTITGNAGGNLLSGGSGNDIIAGGGGNDRLIGGAGMDSLRGGAGDDRFFFNVAPGAANADGMVDFAAADDAIYLLRSVFTGTGANGTLSASAFHQGAAAADAGDRIVYNAATGNIFYDADGTGAAAASLFATVAAGTALSHVDFVIYG